MKKLMALIVVAVSIVGCAGVGGGVSPIAGDVWSNGHMCYSVFPATKDGLTLVTASQKKTMYGKQYGSDTYVFAYNPANSYLAIFWSGANVKTCDNLNGILYSPLIMPRVNIFAIQDAGWKETLDAAATTAGKPNDKVRAIVDFYFKQVGQGGRAFTRDKATFLTTVVMTGGTGQPKDASSVFAELKR